MVFVIQNVKDLRDAIKSSIDNTNGLSREVMENSVSAFLDQTGLVNESVDVLKDELECAVCLDIALQACLTKCNHIFCTYCLQTYTMINKKMKCPLCQTVLGRPVVKSALHTIDTIIVAVMSKHNSQYGSWRKQEINERFCHLYTKIVQKHHDYNVQRLELLKSSNHSNVEILRQGLVDLIQMLQSLLKDLQTCTEENRGDFMKKYIIALTEVKTLEMKAINILSQ